MFNTTGQVHFSGIKNEHETIKLLNEWAIYPTEVKHFGGTKQKDDAKDGDLVVALIDETETTLKRFRKNGKEVVLEAENKNYKSQVYKSGSNIKIQGILSGLIRRYN